MYLMSFLSKIMQFYNLFSSIEQILVLIFHYWTYMFLFFLFLLQMNENAYVYFQIFWILSANEQKLTVSYYNYS